MANCCLVNLYIVRGKLVMDPGTQIRIFGYPESAEKWFKIQVEQGFSLFFVKK